MSWHQRVLDNWPFRRAHADRAALLEDLGRVQHLLNGCNSGRRALYKLLENRDAERDRLRAVVDHTAIGTLLEIQRRAQNLHEHERRALRKEVGHDEYAAFDASQIIADLASAAAASLEERTDAQ